ncbi:enoyl-CoA hydratase/isomerase family protein [Microbacterium sp. NPDC055683]
MDDVLLEVADGVATITMNRPERLNVLDIPVATALADAALRAASSGVEVVVVTGSGRAFTAGGDVQAMAGAADRSAYMLDLVGAANRAMEALAAIPQPVVARVNGIAAGAGIGIVLASDIAVAADTATFTPAYGAIGLVPDCGATALLPRAIGERRASDLLLTGRRIDAATALDWGLVERMAPADGLDEAVRDVVSSIRKAGPTAPAATKGLLSAGGSYSDALAAEREAIAREAATPFSIARVAAFART